MCQEADIRPKISRLGEDTIKTVSIRVILMINMMPISNVTRESTGFEDMHLWAKSANYCPKGRFSHTVEPLSPCTKWKGLIQGLLKDKVAYSHQWHTRDVPELRVHWIFHYFGCQLPQLEGDLVWNPNEPGEMHGGLSSIAWKVLISTHQVSSNHKSCALSYLGLLQAPAFIRKLSSSWCPWKFPPVFRGEIVLQDFRIIIQSAAGAHLKLSTTHRV